MYYRTRTYIAADWDHDKNAVDALHYWNDNSKYGLSFTDAHDLKQAKDTCLNCSIMKSLTDRLNASKSFVLIVGNHTNELRAGGCQYCNSYNSYWESCARGYSVDKRSYIEFECDKAIRDGLKIIVLYKDTKVNRSNCPNAVRWTGIHVPMIKMVNIQYYWDYQTVKNAFDS